MLPGSGGAHCRSHSWGPGTPTHKTGTRPTGALTEAHAWCSEAGLHKGPCPGPVGLLGLGLPSGVHHQRLGPFIRRRPRGSFHGRNLPLHHRYTRHRRVHRRHQLIQARERIPRDLTYQDSLQQPRHHRPHPQRTCLLDRHPCRPKFGRPHHTDQLPRLQWSGQRHLCHRRFAQRSLSGTHKVCSRPRGRTQRPRNPHPPSSWNHQKSQKSRPRGSFQVFNLRRFPSRIGTSL